MHDRSQLSERHGRIHKGYIYIYIYIYIFIGAQSLPGSQNCTNCFCLAPVRPAANARNRQKSKRQQINASKIIGAQSLPGSQNCTKCFCLAPVRPAANARNRQKSKRQQINASKIGAQSLPGSQNCTNCFCLAPVRPAANPRNRQKSKRQQINASKSDWICQNIPTGTKHSTQRQVPMDPLPTTVLWTLNHPAPTGTQPCG